MGEFKKRIKFYSEQIEFYQNGIDDLRKSIKQNELFIRKTEEPFLSLRKKLSENLENILVDFEDRIVTLRSILDLIREEFRDSCMMQMQDNAGSVGEGSEQENAPE